MSDPRILVVDDNPANQYPRERAMARGCNACLMEPVHAQKRSRRVTDAIEHAR